jgi:hypothetical protein
MVNDPLKGLFVLLSIHVDWVGLDRFQSQTSQNLSQFFPIPSNPHGIGITEQALNQIEFNLATKDFWWYT